MNPALNVIPMDFLIAHSPPGATGPSDATDVVGAIRSMTEAGRKGLQRVVIAEARVREMEGHIRDFIHALDRGYLACKDDSAFIDALRDCIS